MRPGLSNSTRCGANDIRPCMRPLEWWVAEKRSRAWPLPRNSWTHYTGSSAPIRGKGPNGPSPLPDYPPSATSSSGRLTVVGLTARINRASASPRPWSMAPPKPSVPPHLLARDPDPPGELVHGAAGDLWQVGGDLDDGHHGRVVSVHELPRCLPPIAGPARKDPLARQCSLLLNVREGAMGRWGQGTGGPGRLQRLPRASLPSPTCGRGDGGEGPGVR